MKAIQRMATTLMMMRALPREKGPGLKFWGMTRRKTMGTVSVHTRSHSDRRPQNTGLVVQQRLLIWRSATDFLQSPG